MMQGLMQSDLFNVSEIEKVNEEIRQQEHDKQNADARKSLTLPYYPNPKNDNERLMNYQYEYITNNNQSAWGELISLSFIVTKRLLWKMMKEQRLIYDNIQQDEIVSEACYYILRRYKKNIGYCVTTSFLAALKDALRHATGYKTELEKNTVYLDDVFGERK